MGCNEASSSARNGRALMTAIVINSRVPGASEAMPTGAMPTLEPARLTVRILSDKGVTWTRSRGHGFFRDVVSQQSCPRE